MLAGIVVNNAIVLVDYVNQLRDAGHAPSSRRWSRPAAVRLRPILMTTLTTVLGLLPMALGIGEGAEVRRAARDHADRRAHRSRPCSRWSCIPVVYATLDRDGR